MSSAERINTVPEELLARAQVITEQRYTAFDDMCDSATGSLQDMTSAFASFAQEAPINAKKAVAGGVVAASLMGTPAVMTLSARPVAAEGTIQVIEDVDELEAEKDIVMKLRDGSTLQSEVPEGATLEELGDPYGLEPEEIMESTNEAAAAQQATPPEAPATTNVHRTKPGETPSSVIEQLGHQPTDENIAKFLEQNGISDPTKMPSNKDMHFTPNASTQQEQTTYTTQLNDVPDKVLRALGMEPNDANRQWLYGKYGFTEKTMPAGLTIEKNESVAPVTEEEYERVVAQFGDTIYKFLVDRGTYSKAEEAETLKLNGMKSGQELQIGQEVLLNSKPLNEVPVPLPAPTPEATATTPPAAEVAAPIVNETVPSVAGDLLPGFDSVSESYKGKVEATMQAIDRLWGVYKEIEAQTGVDASIMAALHFREANNAPDQSIFAGEKLGTTNPDFGDVKAADITQNGIQAAEHFKMMAKAVYGVDVTQAMTQEDLEKAFLAYNRGAMYENATVHIGRPMMPKESPYVVNGMAGYENLRFPNVGQYSRSGDSWGEPESVQGMVDSRPGAMSIYITLEEREALSASGAVLAGLAESDHLANEYILGNIGPEGLSDITKAFIVQKVIEIRQVYPAARIGEPERDSTLIPCPEGTTDIGILQASSRKIGKYSIRGCTIDNLPSTGDEDNEGGKYTNPGANGHATTSSRVAGSLETMIDDMRASGLDPRTASSGRHHDHQKDLFADNPNPTFVAPPGTSRHEGYLAIDFANGLTNKSASANCANKTRQPGNPYSEWLETNAHKYSAEGLPSESWHWQFTDESSSQIC